MVQGDPEIYPMPLFCQLVAADVDSSTAWYEAIGFTTLYVMPVMSHVRYRKYADIMLVADEVQVGEELGDSPRGAGLAIYITVDGESVDDVAARASEYGAEIVTPPYNTTWNTREVAIRDPDGYTLVFTEVSDPEKSFEEVMGEPVLQ